jgi:hypothetical protein
MGEPCHDHTDHPWPTHPGTHAESPLAAPGHATQADVVTAASALTASVQLPLADRESTLAEFEGYLRTVNNRDGRPYEEKTISVYSVPAKNLDGWLTASGIDGDFTVVDTALLNRYFREYYLEHGQGGTHTLQRNLIQLFNFLERERGFASPYTDGLNRYATVKGRPKTLSAEFVDDLLEVTGSGRARDFETARELDTVLAHCGAGIVVYVDALWGLGSIADSVRHPARAVMAVHVLGHDTDLRPALAAADAVIAPSAAVMAEAAARGFSTGDWLVVRNPLLVDPEDTGHPGPEEREQLRRHGPVRVAARLGPEKGRRRIQGQPTRRRRSAAANPGPARRQGRPGQARHHLGRDPGRRSGRRHRRPREDLPGSGRLRGPKGTATTAAWPRYSPGGP